MAETYHQIASYNSKQPIRGLLLLCIAVTPSGHSYERAALLEHLAKVGSFDPISRVQMTESDVRPNLQLRAATQSYLDSHAYAWSEAI